MLGGNKDVSLSCKSAHSFGFGSILAKLAGVDAVLAKLPITIARQIFCHRHIVELRSTARKVKDRCCPPLGDIRLIADYCSLNARAI